MIHFWYIPHITLFYLLQEGLYRDKSLSLSLNLSLGLKRGGTHRGFGHYVYGLSLASYSYCYNSFLGCKLYIAYVQEPTNSSYR